jgi:hypothetical protein
MRFSGGGMMSATASLASEMASEAASMRASPQRATTASTSRPILLPTTRAVSC